MLTSIWDFFFHRPHWEVYARQEFKFLDGSHSRNVYTLRCKHCGEMIVKEVY